MSEILAKPTYLIWSNEHRAWWGPGRRGYVKRIADAGHYSESAALDICTGAMPGRRGEEPLPEIPVPLDLLIFMLQRFSATYHGLDPEPPR